MQLDQTSRNTMRALSMPNLLHGTIESSLPGPRVRNLWRIDRLRGEYYLMLLSPERPNLSEAVRQFGLEEMGWETRDYEPLLARIQEGSAWQFRLVANPTKSSFSGQGKRGEVHAHVSPAYQEQWLLERAEKHGFSLEPDDFRVVNSKWYQFYKGGDSRRRVSLLAVTFEGKLVVTDAALFRETLVQGIGRGKAYGMGMMTVIRGT
jgi:CRISPR system Cascade subunit CasE